MDILDAIKQALNEATEADRQEKVIGKISFKLLREVRDHDDREEEVKEEINARVEALKAEYRPMVKALKVEHNDLWDRIHNEIGVPDEERELRYSLNMKNGDVITYVSKEDQDSILN